MAALKKVYILHGWAYSIDKWSTLTSLLKKAGIEAKLLKIPGLTKKINRPWGMEDYLKWLTKELKGATVLIGHSNGGRIAINFAISNPAKVKRLVLIDSAGIYHNELPLKLKRALFKGLAKGGKRLTSSESLRKVLYKLARSSDYQDAPEEMKQTLINLTSSDKLLDLRKLKKSTTIIWGRDDSTTPLEDGLRMKEEIRYSKMFIVGGAKHSPQFTHAEEVAEIIIREIK